MTQDEIIEMARQAGMALENYGGTLLVRHLPSDSLEAFAKLVAAKEREACARKTGEFAQKWWSIHCASNLHYSSTLKAHRDFCALQAAIRARGEA